MIYPVILTGGNGTRLWPVSRQSYPKQFRRMSGEHSLFQNTILRVQGAGFQAPMIVAGADFQFVVGDQMRSIGAVPRDVLVEPQGRNTAPAILAAALHLQTQDPDACMVILPSDHAVPDVAGFQTMVQGAMPAALQGRIVTFGVRPTRAETGYGYLELDCPARDVPVPLKAFVEKPDAATAARLITTGRHLWNAGIFLFRCDTILGAFQTLAPDLMGPVRGALEGATHDGAVVHLAPDPWAGVRDVSVDYAVMERAENLSVMAFNGAWSDLGSWDAVWRDGDAGTGNVVCIGGAEAVDCENSLLYRHNGAPAVIGMGLDDLVVVSTKDAVLVADKSRAQDVKAAVDHLKSKGNAVATQTPEYHRPWGWYETLALGGRFQVKRIVVNPGGCLSLQSHHHRSEHWIVVEGTAKVTLEDQVRLISENQSIYIPLGAVHRVENPGKLPMVLIEVQTGAYLGEDDIIRYEDRYSRGNNSLRA